MIQLSGRKVEGVIIETIYNNKTKGPEIHEHLSTRSEGHLQKWLTSVEMEVEHIRLHEEADFFPLRTVACDDYGGCMYKEACKKEFDVTALSWLEDNTIEERWDFMNPND
jgi:hypothetical protein